MRIGILGAGQLSRMLALAGIPQGIQFSFYDTKVTQCVESLGKLTVGNYDEKTLEDFLKEVDIVTYENENIPVTVLEYINQTSPVYPGIKPLSVIQDRLLEKNYLNSIDIPTVNYYPINSKEDIDDSIPMPFVIKKRKNSYDGKGQCVVKTEEDLTKVTDTDCDDAIVEQFVTFEREVSLVGCRNTMGEIIFYDIAENQHREGILRKTENKINDPVLEEAQTYLKKILTSFDYVGTCTIEFFQIKGRLIANEIAPRVHNSGHWTIEGAVTSQFANHLRSIMSLPLGSTESRGEYVMYNIIGKLPDYKKMMGLQEVYYHDYEKSPRPARKIGHVTCAIKPNLTTILDSEFLLR